MDELNCARNAVMLAALCGSIPVAINYMGPLLGGVKLVYKKVAAYTAIAICLPYVISLMAAVVSLHSRRLADDLFVSGCVILACISVVAVAYGVVIASVSWHLSHMQNGRRNVQPEQENKKSC